jgi:hypothetical protein
MVSLATSEGWYEVLKGCLKGKLFLKYRAAYKWKEGKMGAKAEKEKAFIQ